MPRDEDDLPDLLTTMDVARIFRVARSTVSGWADRGLLPYTRTPSGRIRFDRDDVNRLLAHNPFPDKPPRYIRAMFYRYRFTALSEFRQTGAWWKRQELREYLPTVSQDQLRNP